MFVISCNIIELLNKRSVGKYYNLATWRNAEGSYAALYYLLAKSHGVTRGCCCTFEISTIESHAKIGATFSQIT